MLAAKENEMNKVEDFEPDETINFSALVGDDKEFSARGRNTDLGLALA